ncbi:MAG: branched-chain-amino-acid transaminase [Betaproteobacteria bacterium]
MDETIYVDGRMVPAAEAAVSVCDHGLLYGDGVFEGIRAYSGRVFRLDQHIERLFASARAIRLEIPGTPDEIAAAVVAACRHNDIVDGYIRLVVTRGAGDLSVDPRSCRNPRVIVITLASMTVHRDADRGLHVVTSPFRRNAPDATSPSIKSLNYLNNVLARIDANDRGADEALLLDAQGYVAEATVENFFIVTKRGLLTPPTSTNLDGITRAAVLEIASSLVIRCEERSFTLVDAWNADEAFLCGTAAEIVPVVTIDRRPVGTGRPGPATLRIIDAFRRLVRSTGTPIYPGAAESAAVGGFRG